MSFKVGDEVVCVDDDFGTPPHWSIANAPVKGQKYTIREAFPHYTEAGVTSVRLVEVVNPIFDYPIVNLKGYEAAFYAHRFRGIEKRKTDISIFTAMLHPTQEKVKA